MKTDFILLNQHQQKSQFLKEKDENRVFLFQLSGSHRRTNSLVFPPSCSADGQRLSRRSEPSGTGLSLCRLRLTRSPSFLPLKRKLHSSVSSLVICTPATGVNGVEAVCRRAAQEERGVREICPDLQRPAAKGGRGLHPHIRGSHE